ncbi:MAG: diguanylate cyclase [Huintestinicola sp.]
MKDKNRLTIGFMIHHLDNDYSKALIKGAVAASEDLDANLIIFPGRSLNSQLNDLQHTVYEYQNNVIYSYASAENLDALVISAGTIGSFVTNEEFKTFVDSFGELPVITTENKVRGYPCIRLSGSGIKEIVNHLIKVHGKKHIAFVSGPKGNADADERLGYYKEALYENGMDFDPDMVAYGKFSEYCVDIVGDLIDRNAGKIDAICFANDMMCKGGYKAIEKRGLRVGQDIAVTGYDDSEVASVLNPMLTTVRADASQLGYRAVSEAIEMAKGSKPDDMISLGSSPVFRQSCGREALNSNDPQIFERSSSSLASGIVSEVLSGGETGTKLRELIALLTEDITSILDYARTDSLSPLDFRKMASDLGEKQIMSLIPVDSLIKISNLTRRTALALCSGNMERSVVIYGAAEYIMETIADRTITMHYAKINDLTFTNFLINNITKDMTLYGRNEEQTYFSIVNNLFRIHMASSYIYTYPEPIVHTSRMEWKLPKSIMLKSCHNGESLTAIPQCSQLTPIENIFSNDYTPDRRRTMILSPLFMNEEQYGVILCEPEYEYFTYIYSITPQICTAIKLSNLVTQLESSLDAAKFRNSQLNRISMCDELTGVYNRRGFYEFTNRILRAPENEGKHAVLIFGDLDNLKKINDNFGHDDGDYAIVSAAEYLKSGLRNTDIVARIGGDEFAAFALCENTEIIKSLPSRIKTIAAAHNAESSKPYNVTVSIGTYELQCSPKSNIQDFMDKADAALYQDKKNKNPDIMKHGVNNA